MKHSKTKVLLTSAALCSLYLHNSCGNSHKESISDSDSIAVMEMVETVAASNAPAHISKDSIGKIYIGMPMHEIQDSVPALYTRKENGASPDAVTVTFSNDNGEQFVAYDFGEGKIDVLNVIGTDVAVMSPQGDIRLGDSFRKVLELPGVESEWSGYDDSGTWYWTWNGLWFAPAQDKLPSKLSQLLYHSDKEPTADDFSDEVSIGFIGTGLPF